MFQFVMSPFPCFIPHRNHLIDQFVLGIITFCHNPSQLYSLTLSLISLCSTNLSIIDFFVLGKAFVVWTLSRLLTRQFLFLVFLDL